MLDAADLPHIYRHGVQLRLEGSYFDVLAYVTDLEQSGWQFRWRSLDYRVTDYPRAVVDLHLETLSRDRELIGF